MLLIAYVGLGSASVAAAMLAYFSVTRSRGSAVEGGRALTLELPLLLLLGPLFLFETPLLPVGPAVVLGLWVARRLLCGYFLPRTPLDWPVALMCAMLPVGMLVSPSLEWSVGRAATVVYGVALYYALAHRANNARWLSRIVAGYLALGGAMALLALLGTDWQAKAPLLSGLASLLPNLSGALSRDATGFHPNIVAGALLWVIFPLGALTPAAWNRGRGLRDNLHAAGLVALLVLTVGTFLLTQSRAAWLSALGGLVLLGWLALPRRRLAVMIGGALVAAGVFVLLAFAWPAQREGASFNQRGDENLLVRVDTWRSALNAIGDYPLTGVGLDAFRRLMPVRYPALSVPDRYDIGHAHNQMLQAALDLGLPGLVGYAAIWVGAGIMVVRLLGSRRAALGALGRSFPQALQLVWGIAAALFASFLHGLGDAVAMVSKPGIFFWAMLGLLAAVWRLTASTRASTLEE